MYFSKRKKKNQKGYVLILAIFVAAFFMTMTALTSQYTLGTLRSTRLDFQKVSQAKNVAEAGLQEAAFWFESTQMKPAIIISSTSWCDGGTSGTSCLNGVIKTVPAGIPPNFANHLAFRPIEATSTLSRGDTDNKEKGIVRDILIDKQNKLYGHYEVLRYNPDNWTANNDQNLNTAVMDISDEKSTTLDGAGNNTQSGKSRYWRIISTGTLYRRDPDKASINNKGVFDITYDNKDLITGNPVSDNAKCCQIIGKYTLSENLLKIKYDDSKAAIALQTPSQFNSFVNSIIVANSTSDDLTVKSNDSGSFISSLTIGNGLTGYNNTDGILKVAGFSFNTYSVFGVSAQEMKGIADQKATTLSQLRRDADTGRFGSSEIIYLEGSAGSTFIFGTPTASPLKFPLKGGGILYVKNANLTLENMGNSLFNGVIYMDGGNLTIGGLNSITGSIYVSSGTLNINGGSEKADIGYNKRVIDNVMASVSKYKEDSLSYKSISVK